MPGLLTDSQLQAIQRLGEQSFKVSCTVRKRLPFAKDLGNPYGDSDVSYAATTVTVLGWLVPTSTVDFMSGVRQVISSGQYRLRIPVSTDCEPGDKVTILGEDYYCSESTTEQTWPEWLIVRLRRIQ